jgi:hypothetical protein
VERWRDAGVDVAAENAAPEVNDEEMALVVIVRMISTSPIPTDR